MPTITITGGGKTNAYSGENGTFAATLVTFGELITTDNEGNQLISDFTGKPYSTREWVWAINDAPEDNNLVWARTSGFAGPKSTQFAWLTALFGGTQPPAGVQMTEKDIEGREALISIARDATSGWFKVSNVVPLPRAMQKPGAPKGAPAPVIEAVDRALPF